MGNCFFLWWIGFWVDLLGFQLMTYRQLLSKLTDLPSDKLDLDISILLMSSDEVVEVMDFVSEWKESQTGHNYSMQAQSAGIDRVDGVLDEGHPYLTVAF